MACHPERGGDSRQMLVNRRNSRVMSKVLESGAAPPGGNSCSHWGLCKTFFLKRSSSSGSFALRSATKLAGG